MKKLMILSALAAFGATGLVAQDGDSSSDKAKASVLIVHPLKVSKTADMWFGEYILDPTVTGIKGVLLESYGNQGSDVTTYRGLQKWGNKAENGPAHTARFTIAGEKDYTCLVSTPKEITLTNTTGGPNGTVTLKVNCTDATQTTWISGNTWQMTLSTGEQVATLNNVGTAKFYVGGSLELPADCTPGWYRGTFDVSVEYN